VGTGDAVTGWNVICPISPCFTNNTCSTSDQFVPFFLGICTVPFRQTVSFIGAPLTRSTSTPNSVSLVSEPHRSLLMVVFLVRQLVTSEAHVTLPLNCCLSASSDGHCSGEDRSATYPSLLFPPLLLLLILLILLFTYISRNENVVAKNTRAARRSLPRSTGTSMPAGGRPCEGGPRRFANKHVPYLQTIKTDVSSTLLRNNRYVTRTFHVCSCMPRGSRASSLPGRVTYRKGTQRNL